jgi:hypothetical protein
MTEGLAARRSVFMCRTRKHTELVGLGSSFRVDVVWRIHILKMRQRPL